MLQATNLKSKSSRFPTSVTSTELGNTFNLFHLSQLTFFLLDAFKHLNKQIHTESSGKGAVCSLMIFAVVFQHFVSQHYK